MSSDIAIKVDGLSKCYQIYDQPRDRLKQIVLPRLQKIAGMPQRNYYREFWALRDIDFEVRKGEAFGIVGRNGGGKSTLLQIITGTLDPTRGTVETFGRVAALLELGSGFNPEFTGRENVYLNALMLGMSRDEVNARFDSIAAFADIGGFLDQQVKTYSSGMLVRLAFAVQVQLEPDILIVDEALAVGDALFQKRCFRRIEKLRADGVTLLFVSHDQEAVRTLTERAILLKRGTCVSSGASSQVLLDYRRLMHEEESAYFIQAMKDIQLKTSRVGADSIDSSSGAFLSENGVEQGSPSGPTDDLSFGDGGVEILTTTLFDSDGNPGSVFYPGDLIRVRMECLSRIEATNLNVAVRVRNREGIKIYSWGTLNQDMRIMESGSDELIFWNRRFNANEKFVVWLEFDCRLGTNLYEIQAAISHEESPDYGAQRILHWKDEAAFFQVLMRKNEYFFGGLTDLCMTARWDDAEQE